MFNISVINVLTMLFEISSTDAEKAFMEYEDDGTRTVNAMIIPVHMTVADYSDGDKKREAHDSVYVMYAGRHSIFYAHARDSDGYHRNFNAVPVEEWENTSNHDSCWRSDGFSFLTKTYFNMAKSANNDKPPCELHDYTNLGIGRQPVTKTQVMVRTRKDGYNYDIVKVV
jgi:hypothetical protein